MIRRTPAPASGVARVGEGAARPQVARGMPARRGPALTAAGRAPIHPRPSGGVIRPPASVTSAADDAMKIKNSLRSLLKRDRNNRLVRRKGRVYIINKKAPRYKARQG